MSTNPENPYRVLGVERTADERAIKKAYVALIRTHTPEADPEQFQKIRAAYECLTDPDARKRFDESEKGYDEYGDEVGKRLAAVDEALTKDKPELAREILEDLRKRFPDVVVVQEKLGHVLFGAGKFADAFAVFDALAKKDPTHARHHLHLGFALARLERYEEAGRALSRAHSLDPKDVGIATAMVNYHIAHDQSDRAIAVVTKTLPLLDPASPAVPSLLLRKVDALATAGRMDELEPTFQEIERICARVADPELRPALGAQLGQIAAKLFAAKHPTAANTILARCATLHPDSAAHPLPTRIDLHPDDVPAAFREWLDAVAANTGSQLTLRHNTWLKPVAAFLGLAVAAWIAYELGTEARAPWSADQAFVVFAVFVALWAGILAWSRWILHIYRSNRRTFTTLHPLYLVQVSPLRVRLYPLFALTEATGVHQHTNGIYTGTNLTFRFGEPGMPGGRQKVGVSISGQQRAQGWIDALLGIRGRSLELLAEGCLEAESLVDRLSPRALAALPPHAPWRGWRTWIRPLAVGALVAGVLTAGGAWRSVRASDDAAVARAAARHSIAGWRGYLLERPDGRHADTAKAEVRAAFDRALARFRADPARPPEVLLAKAVEYVRDHDGGIHYDVRPSGPAFGEGAREAGGGHLARALGVAGFAALVAPGKGSDGPQIAVDLETGPEATLLAGAETVTVYGATVTTRITIPGEPPYEQVTTLPPPTRIFARKGEPADAVAARRLLEDALDAATAALGLRGPMARVEGAP